MIFGGLALLLFLDRVIIDPTTRSSGGVPIHEGAMIFFFMMACAILVCGLFITITDHSLQSTRIYVPFVKRRMAPLGRALLYPGWGSGFFFVGLISAMMLLFRVITVEDLPEEVYVVLLGAFNFLMLPALITRYIMHRRNVRIFQLSTYITMMVSCAIASVVLLLAETLVLDGEPVVTMFLTIPAFAGLDMGEESLAFGMQAIAAFITYGLLAIFSATDLAFTGRREDASREFLAKKDLTAKEASPEESVT